MATLTPITVPFETPPLLWLEAVAESVEVVEDVALVEVVFVEMT